MLKERRCDLILSELNKKNSVTINELISLTGSSRSTICRDIEELEAANRLCRVHGGIVKPASTTASHEPPFLIRQDMYLEEKQRIAAAAHDIIKPKETLLLGGGTTIYELAKVLSDISPLYVATNDLKSAITLAEYHNVDLTVLGGSLRQSHYSLNGYFTEHMVGQMHADKAFIGIDAVDFHLGYMNFSTSEIQTNKLMLQASHQKIVLCDHSKFECIAFVSLCQLHEVNMLITGKEIKDSHLRQLKEAGVDVITV